MLDHVFITVKDLDRSIAFYETALKPLGIVHAIDYDAKDGPKGHPDLKGFGRDGRVFFWLRQGDADARAAHIAPGREGLFNLIKGIPPTLKYEPGVIAAEGDFVLAHGRFSGFGAPVNWIAADIVRLKDGILVEHWDVIQDEATKEQSKSGNPMFGTTFPP